MMQLTNDTYRIFRLIYDEYQNRRKIGMSKTEAILFSYPSALQTEFLQGILEDDIADALTELSTNGLIKLYSDFGFLLKDSAIIYMENRLQNKVNLIFDIISKIVSMLH
mgnify:FL=1|jgi:hypothetical protein